MTGRPKQTHCQRGHAFSPANTYTSPKGARACRACMALAQERFRLRQAQLRQGTTTSKQGRRHPDKWYQGAMVDDRFRADIAADGRHVWLALHSAVRHDVECFDGWPLDQTTETDFAPLRHDGVCGPLTAVPHGGGVTPWDALEAVLDGPWERRRHQASGRIMRMPASTGRVMQAVNSW